MLMEEDILHNKQISPLYTSYILKQIEYFCEIRRKKNCMALIYNSQGKLKLKKKLKIPQQSNIIASQHYLIAYQQNQLRLIDILHLSASQIKIQNNPFRKIKNLFHFETNDNWTCFYVVNQMNSLYLLKFKNYSSDIKVKCLLEKCSNIPVSGLSSFKQSIYLFFKENQRVKQILMNQDTVEKVMEKKQVYYMYALHGWKVIGTKSKKTHIQFEIDNEKGGNWKINFQFSSNLFEILSWNNNLFILNHKQNKLLLIWELQMFISQFKILQEPKILPLNYNCLMFNAFTISYNTFLINLFYLNDISDQFSLKSLEMRKGQPEHQKQIVDCLENNIGSLFTVNKSIVCVNPHFQSKVNQFCHPKAESIQQCPIIRTSQINLSQLERSQNQNISEENYNQREVEEKYQEEENESVQFFFEKLLINQLPICTKLGKVIIQKALNSGMLISDKFYPFFLLIQQIITNSQSTFILRKENSAKKQIQFTYFQEEIKKHSNIVRILTLIYDNICEQERRLLYQRIINHNQLKGKEYEKLINKTKSLCLCYDLLLNCFVSNEGMNQGNQKQKFQQNLNKIVIHGSQQKYHKIYEIQQNSFGFQNFHELIFMGQPQIKQKYLSIKQLINFISKNQNFLHNAYFYILIISSLKNQPFNTIQTPFISDSKTSQLLTFILITSLKQQLQNSQVSDRAIQKETIQALMIKDFKILQYLCMLSIKIKQYKCCQSILTTLHINPLNREFNVLLSQEKRSKIIIEEMKFILRSCVLSKLENLGFYYLCSKWKGGQFDDYPHKDIEEFFIRMLVKNGRIQKLEKYLQQFEEEQERDKIRTIYQEFQRTNLEEL